MVVWEHAGSDVLTLGLQIVSRPQISIRKTAVLAVYVLVLFWAGAIQSIASAQSPIQGGLSKVVGICGRAGTPLEGQ